MMLVPPSHPTIQSPLITKLGRLDQEMKTILDRPDIDEETKIQEYSQILSKYLNVQNKLRQPTPIPIVDKRQPTIPKINTLNLSSIPLPYQKKARLIAEHLQQDPTIDWNERNELLLSGSTIPNSNVIDLIDDLARPNSRSQPTGIKQLVEELKRSNIPKSIIGNKNRLVISRQDLNSPPTLSPIQVSPRTPRRQTSPHYFEENPPSSPITPETPFQTTPRRRSSRKQRGRGRAGRHRSRWSHW